MIQLPTESKIVKKEGNKATIEIGPLYPGYGSTIGNVLRRVLISSLEGSAVTAAKIQNVDHEFTTVEGIKEDVVELIFNLKKVRFKVYSEEPVTLSLTAKGKKTVTAKDIKTTAEAEVVNTDQIIATLTDKKSEIDMELIVEKGIGYVPVEQKKKEKLTVGEIAIDGIFSPIKRVNFTTENIRVGQRTDYNKVILEIETDGTIEPEESLKKASKLIVDHFDVISKIGEPNAITDLSDALKMEAEIESAEEEVKEKPRKVKSKSN